MAFLILLLGNGIAFNLPKYHWVSPHSVLNIYPTGDTGLLDNSIRPMSSLILPSRLVPFGGMKTADGPITGDSKCKVAMFAFSMIYHHWDGMSNWIIARFYMALSEQIMEILNKCWNKHA